MAGILNVNEDELGLYLKDDRISPSDTPSSVNLHIADILGKMSYLKVLFFNDWMIFSLFCICQALVLQIKSHAYVNISCLLLT